MSGRLDQLGVRPPAAVTDPSFAIGMRPLVSDSPDHVITLEEVSAITLGVHDLMERDELRSPVVVWLAANFVAQLIREAANEPPRDLDTLMAELPEDTTVQIRDLVRRSNLNENASHPETRSWATRLLGNEQDALVT